MDSFHTSRMLVLDRYDGTQATDNLTRQVPGLGVLDHSMRVLGGALLPTFMDYVRRDLGLVTDSFCITRNQNFG